MTVAYFVLPLDGFGARRPEVSWTVFIAVLAVLACLLLLQIRNILIDKPGTHPVVTILLLMFLSLLIFSATYYALARHQGAFVGLQTRLDALYFTVVTLATVGYGDVVPQSQTARLVTMVQILYSFVFLTAAATAVTRRLRTQVGDRLGHNEPR
ncbi:MULTISPECIES: potassium channel family protein [unclassified Streptomyces]|uniref:potassium channel family protein n=1 Tax=unclassified Streptomyces TaxID=2593676 RepID=UPI002DD8E615|nr:potassium channel family protein [Streptomyces sp. NBC_01750]WSB01283.1 potassium channel family protein [Streptomyces sp. NBC_01794]WSD34371.1 potassium channel family protein [Streptomyces sp. NBC_01750]